MHMHVTAVTMKEGSNLKSHKFKVGDNKIYSGQYVLAHFEKFCTTCTAPQRSIVDALFYPTGCD